MKNTTRKEEINRWFIKYTQNQIKKLESVVKNLKEMNSYRSVINSFERKLERRKAELNEALQR